MILLLHCGKIKDRWRIYSKCKQWGQFKWLRQMFHLWKIMLRINWWRWPDICKKPSLYCSIVRRIKGVIIFEALLYLQQNMSLVQIRRRHVIVLLNVPTYLNKELTLGNEVQESRAERDSFFRDGTWGRARHQNMRFLVISTFLNNKHFFQSLNTKHHHRKKATIIVNPPWPCPV